MRGLKSQLAISKWQLAKQKTGPLRRDSRRSLTISKYGTPGQAGQVRGQANRDLFVFAAAKLPHHHNSL
jgi:hypothetical protein